MKKINKLLFLSLILFSFLSFDYVTAASCDDKTDFSQRFDCLQKKYNSLPLKKVDTDNCNISKEACAQNENCVWIEKAEVGKQSCGINYSPNNSAFSCYYAADLNGSSGIYIELVFNGAWLVSGNFKTDHQDYLGSTNVVKIIPDTEVGTNFSPVIYDDNGESFGFALYCPSSIYFASSIINDSTYERTIYIDKPSEIVDLATAKLLSDNTYDHMMTVDLLNPPITDVPVKEPLTCKYDNLTSGTTRVTSITYVSENLITADYTDDTGLVKNYNVDAIYESDAFKNWECVDSNSIFVQILPDSDSNIMTAYIAYDKNLLPDPDQAHEFTPSDEDKDDSNENNGDSDKPIKDVCEVLPESIKNYLMDALKLIRWVSLALMIVLGTLDFVKASASDDQDALKKAWQNFIKRLIAVIILFLLPILVEFILYIAGLAGFGECYPITDF